MSTTVAARIPGEHSGFSYSTVSDLDVTLILAFLRNRGFTEVTSLEERINPQFLQPAGPECVNGWLPKKR